MIHLPTLRQLRHFACLADTLNFGRAAKSANVTQSTLSASLQELEATLGAGLVDRTRRRVVLTPLGERILVRARRLLADAEELALEAKGAGEPLAGDLRLGVIPSVSPFWMPKALPALRKAYPKLRLYLVEDLTERLVEKLAAGALDAALLALPCECGPNEGATLGRDPFRLVVRKDNALAARKSVSPAEIRRQKLLLLADGHCMKKHALAACGLRESRDPDPFAATSIFTLVQMVDNGLGVTLLPQMAIDAGLLKGTALAAVAVDDDPARDLGLVWRKGTARRGEFELLAKALAKATSGIHAKVPARV
ncbi:MAG: hydrogen peroxide-inducible genes activator [Rhodospirillales bacterium]|nr:hydrogen peroxide-inducible genes activator [Rhodospirillales bacterium]